MPDRTTGGPCIWQANDGSNKASYELQAVEVKFLSPFDGEGGGAPAEHPPITTEEEIPF